MKEASRRNDGRNEKKCESRIQSHKRNAASEMI